MCVCLIFILNISQFEQYLSFQIPEHSFPSNGQKPTERQELLQRILKMKAKKIIWLTLYFSKLTKTLQLIKFLINVLENVTIKQFLAISIYWWVLEIELLVEGKGTRYPSLGFLESISFWKGCHMVSQNLVWVQRCKTTPGEAGQEQKLQNYHKTATSKR